jgi:hypothetical protein
MLFRIEREGGNKIIRPQVRSWDQHARRNHQASAWVLLATFLGGTAFAIVLWVMGWLMAVAR